MRLAREDFPMIHQRLERLRQLSPQEFQRMARRVYAWLRPVIEMRKSNPLLARKLIEEHRLQMDIVDLAEQYRKATSDDHRSHLKTQIEIRIRERFDRQQERTRMEIERLRRRLEDRERRKEELLRQELGRALRPPAPRPESDSR